MQLRIADTFTASLARLRNDEQKAVKTTAFDLQLDPSNPGMRFHRIDRSKDPNFWSIRVNADIRLIVHKSSSSLLLCYVNHHDKAYQLAERRRLERHPKTGAAQRCFLYTELITLPGLAGQRVVSMLWNKDDSYTNEPFDLESDLEESVMYVSPKLFGPDRIYLDVKKHIARRSGGKNVPDGYLIDLSSKRQPRLFVVENELARHDPLKHVAAQILEFSLAFETSSRRVKEVVKAALSEDKRALSQCRNFAEENGFENVDVLLERMIYPSDAFHALVIIDEASEDLEHALVRRFQFPVEIVILRRFTNSAGKRFYEFEPFLSELDQPDLSEGNARSGRVDLSEIDTVVVPAQDDGFEEVFVGEDRWYKIKINSSVIPKLRHIAAYRVAPVSAITHIANIESIEPWMDSNKYVVNFAAPARKIGPIPLKPNGVVKAPQSRRYTSLALLEDAETLDDAFPR